MKSLRNWAAVVVLFLSFLCGPSFGQSNRIRMDGDRLTVHVRNMALRELLETVGEVTGVQFILGEGLAPKAVTLDFDSLPVAEGIKKVVRSLNHATIRDDSGRLAKVFIFGQGETASRSAARRATRDSRRAARAQASPPAALAPEDVRGLLPPDTGPPVESEPAYYPGPPMDKTQAGGGPPAESEPIHYEGPPMAETPEGGGPPGSKRPPGKEPVEEDTSENRLPGGPVRSSASGPAQD